MLDCFTFVVAAPFCWSSTWPLFMVFSTRRTTMALSLIKPHFLPCAVPKVSWAAAVTSLVLLITCCQKLPAQSKFCVTFQVSPWSQGCWRTRCACELQQLYYHPATSPSSFASVVTQNCPSQSRWFLPSTGIPEQGQIQHCVHKWHCTVLDVRSAPATLK